MDTTVNDRYELQDVLGSGGMGEVRKAHDRRLDRTVAIKFLRHGSMSNDIAQARMRSEALLAASIHHPGVAQVFDYDEAQTVDGGSAFIVMQYVEGRSLSELLREEGPLAVEQVMSIVVQVASGLQAAHAAGVVHRDIKPANIMLTPAGRTVLVDFGLAQSESSDPLTDTGTILGTAQYSSPEQSAGRPATPQSDLYSLGVVAHHCLTGESPFRRDTPIATALAHLNDAPPQLGADVPAAARDLLGSLTAKNPSERPQTAAAVVEMASDIGADDHITMPPTRATTSPDRDAPTRTSVQAAAPARTTRARVIVLAAAALLLMLLGAFAWWPAGTTSTPDVVGMSADQASAALRESGLTPRTSTVDLVGGQPDAVVKQTPEAGQPAPSDGVVTLSVVSGKVPVSADDVIGLPYADAATFLEEMGFVVAREESSQAGDIGQVVALDRSGRLTAGSTITLTVAVAPEAAPDATGTTSAPDDNGKGKDKDKKDKKKDK